MSEPERSPFARLVLFMICLAIAGSVVAGAHYYAVDLPAQKNLQAPENRFVSSTSCDICRANCMGWEKSGYHDYYECIDMCGGVCH